MNFTNLKRTERTDSFFPLRVSRIHQLLVDSRGRRISRIQKRLHEPTSIFDAVAHPLPRFVHPSKQTQKSAPFGRRTWAASACLSSGAPNPPFALVNIAHLPLSLSLSIRRSKKAREKREHPSFSTYLLWKSLAVEEETDDIVSGAGGGRAERPITSRPT